MDTQPRPLARDTHARETHAGDDDGMAYFTLMLFEADDTVAGVQAIKTRTIMEAKSMADQVMLTAPRLAGYQLWLHGRLVVATFPMTVPAALPAA